MKDFHPDTVKKINSGMYILCECGTSHSGKYPKCANCTKKVCTNCSKAFLKGASKLCPLCRKRALSRSNYVLA